MKAIIYGKDWCVYCNRAKQLLEEKNIEYEYINIEEDEKLLAKMKEISNNASTVPQIVLDETFVGGFDNLREYFKLNQ